MYIALKTCKISVSYRCPIDFPAVKTSDLSEIHSNIHTDKNLLCRWFVLCNTFLKWRCASGKSII